MTNTKIHVIFTKGLIASGKSTWARQFVKDNQSYKRVSRDDLRHMLSSYTFNDTNETIVSIMEKQIVLKLLAEGCNIIIDAQHLNEKYITDWKRFVKMAEPNCTFEFEIKEFPITLGEAIERDKKRDFVIGEKVIKQTWRKYEKVLQEMVDNSKPKFKFKENLPEAYIFDIDGSVALKHPDRNIYDGTKCYMDVPIIPVLNVAKSLFESGYEIIFLSGRDSKYYNVTYNWLCNHYRDDCNSFHLFMRKEGDNRQDAIIKKEIFLNEIAKNYNVLGVFDDRPQVLRLWQNDIGLWTFALNQDVDCKNDF